MSDDFSATDYARANATHRMGTFKRIYKSRDTIIMAAYRAGFGRTAISRQMGISRGVVYRVIADHTSTSEAD
jgi:DNA-binding transcriptional regulator LsrR (DeoR family)